jgi:hypothetical protein
MVGLESGDAKKNTVARTALNPVGGIIGGAGGIGLAGRAFACMRMPFRATNSTQVLFV